MTYEDVFDNRNTAWGYPGFMEWDKAVHPANGYITSDHKMTFQVHISADPVKWM